MIVLKRVYEPCAKSDGYRVLVDRLWPRGVSKAQAKLDLWLKDIGPSDALRKWFGHDDARWPEFRRRYKEELRGKKELVAELAALSKKHKKTTLLFGAKNEEHNQAVVIAGLLK